ncbi:MAG: hypothetical protein ACRDNS_19545, partial [Trebonia sp.]
AWDPHPSVSAPDGNGTSAPSTFGWAIPYINAVRAGNISKLDRLLADPRYGGNFYVYNPGLNAWLAHQINRVRNNPASILRYLAEGHNS